MHFCSLVTALGGICAFEKNVSVTVALKSVEGYNSVLNNKKRLGNVWILKRSGQGEVGPFL